MNLNIVQLLTKSFNQRLFRAMSYRAKFHFLFCFLLFFVFCFFFISFSFSFKKQKQKQKNTHTLIHMSQATTITTTITIITIHAHHLLFRCSGGSFPTKTFVVTFWCNLLLTLSSRASGFDKFFCSVLSLLAKVSNVRSVHCVVQTIGTCSGTSTKYIFNCCFPGSSCLTL